MLKKRTVLYFSILLMFCQVMIFTSNVSAISENQEQAIVEHCDSIKDNLKNLQRIDSKTRVYLGGYYETILTKFITPLNVRLVENNLSNAGFVENQNKFAEVKSIFSNDFINYQQNLEELVLLNCKTEPAKFYEQLEKTRQSRKIVGQDVLRLRSLISDHFKLINTLKEEL